MAEAIVSSRGKRSDCEGHSTATEPARKIQRLQDEWHKLILNEDINVSDSELLNLIKQKEHIDELDLSRRSFSYHTLVSLCEGTLGLRKLVIRDIKFHSTSEPPMIPTMSAVCPTLTDIDITGCGNISKKLILGDLSLSNPPSIRCGITVHDHLQGNNALKILLNPSELRNPDVIINESEIRKLVESGVPVDSSLDGWSLLDTACVANDGELAKWLMETKDKISDENVSGKSAYNQRALFTAAKYNGHSVIQVLLEHNADVNDHDEDGRTALHWAAANNSHETARVLVEHNADVNAEDKDGRTALHYAAEKNNHETARELVERNADVNAEDEDGRTALHWAAENNSHETAQMLVEHNAEVNSRDITGRTSLHYAAEMNHHEIARVLLEHDADGNDADEDGRTALHWAAGNNSHETARVLVEHNADVDARDITGRTSLHFAALVNSHDTARVLVEHNADVNDKDEDGRTALHLAAENNNHETIQLLLEHNVDVSSLDKNCAVILHWAAENNYEQVIRALLKHNIDVNAKNEAGRTALHLAAVNNNHKTLRVLLEYNADVSSLDETCAAILPWAAESNFEHVVKTLINHNVDINAQDKCGQTALHWAAKNNNHELVRMLIEHDADANARDKCGWTALQWAAKNDNRDTVQLLLEHNADVEAKNEHGQKSLHWAAMNSNHDTVRLLLKHNADVSNLNEECQSILHWAVEKKYSHVVRFLFENNIDVNMEDEAGETDLFLAAKNNNNNALRVLMENSTNVKDRDRGIQNLTSVLHDAINNKNEDLVKILIDHGDHDATARSVLSTRVLHYVIQCADVNIVNVLLKRGADPKYCNEKGETPLSVALQSQDLAITRLLLQKGADVNAMNAAGDRLLISYVLHQKSHISLDVLRLLVEFGVHLRSRTEDGDTLLHMLLNNLIICDEKEESLMSVLTFLLDEKFQRNLSVKSRDNSGNTPLHLWSQLPPCFDRPIVDETETFVERIGSTLFAHGSLANSLNDSDQSPFHLARSSRVVDLLLKNGTAINQQDAEGNTPLLSRVKSLQSNSSFLYDPKDTQDSPEKQFRELFKSGVDPWIENNQTENVFSVLIEKDNFKLAKVLIQVIADSDPTDVNRQNSSGDAPLHIACRSSNPESHSLIDYLLHRSAKPNIFNNNSETPLHVTCKRAIEQVTSAVIHISVVGCLLNYGADIAIKDKEGRTCLDISNVNEEVSRALKNPSRTLRPTQILRWREESQRHKPKLSQVSCGQRCQRLGPCYYHEDVIGSGAFSQVYAGINEKDGREIALKRVNKMELKRPEDRREITNLVKLTKCEQVVTYIDVIEDKHAVFIILELMEGTLNEYLTIRADSKHDISLCSDIVRGLNFLHQHNPPVVHRDIKPGNVLYKILDRPCLKIADFGLSTQADTNASENTVGTGSAFAGTRCWTAPEILTGKVKPTKEADVFATGLVLHAILANKKHPFAPENTTGMSKEHLKITTETNLIKYNQSIDATLSPEAQDLIKGMLYKDEIKKLDTTRALAHPFFWSNERKHRFLSAVRNQEQFEAPRGKFAPTQIEIDLESGLGNDFVSNPWNSQVLAIYNQVTISPRSRKYDTSSAVSLVRFVRITLVHIPTGMKELVLEKFEFLTKFPSLVMEVYKAVIAHGWDTKKEIQFVLKEAV